MLAIRLKNNVLLQGSKIFCERTQKKNANKGSKNRPNFHFTTITLFYTEELEFVYKICGGEYGLVKLSPFYT